MQFPCFPPYLLLEVLTWPAVLVIFLLPSFVFPYHWNKCQQDHGIKVETLAVICRRGFIQGCKRARNVKQDTKISTLQPTQALRQQKTCAGSIKVASFTLKTLFCQVQVQSGGGNTYTLWGY